MHKIAVGTAAILVLATPAFAAAAGQADNGVSPVPQARNWTGCYAGGHAGGVWANSEKWINKTPGGAHFGESLGRHHLNGWLAGVQAGCDYELNRVVFGIQGNYSWTGAKSSHPSAQELGVTYHSEIKSVASITGRVGYAWDRLLAYATGGVAWERNKYAATTTMIGFERAYSATDTRSGWTLGAGGEYVVSRPLSLFVEYNYYGFGTKDVHLTPQVSGLPPARADIEETAQAVRAGVNLRF